MLYLATPLISVLWHVGQTFRGQHRGSWEKTVVNAERSIEIIWSIVVVPNKESRDNWVTPNRVPMVLIVFCRDSWGLWSINTYNINTHHTHYIYSRAYTRISHMGPTLVGVHPTIPWKKSVAEIVASSFRNYTIGPLVCLSRSLSNATRSSILDQVRRLPTLARNGDGLPDISGYTHLRLAVYPIMYKYFVVCLAKDLWCIQNLSILVISNVLWDLQRSGMLMGCCISLLQQIEWISMDFRYEATILQLNF